MHQQHEQEQFDSLAHTYLDKQYPLSPLSDLGGRMKSPDGRFFPHGVSYQTYSFDFGTEVEEYHFGEQFLKRWYHARSYEIAYEHQDRFGVLHKTEDLPLFER